MHRGDPVLFEDQSQPRPTARSYRPRGPRTSCSSTIDSFVNLLQHETTLVHAGTDTGTRIGDVAHGAADHTPSYRRVPRDLPARVRKSSVPVPDIAAGHDAYV